MPTSDADPIESLPLRLREVIPLLAEGRSNDEIAAERVVSKHTAEKYVSDLKRALGARDRVELVLQCKAAQERNRAS